MKLGKIVCGLAVLSGLGLSLSGIARADQTVQVPLADFMTARAVTTLTGGKLVPWTMGIDGGGAADGYMTAAASKFHNDPSNLKALPDNGTFAAEARHPEVVLHFSNDADATSQQTYWVKGAGNFTFPVPAATYSKMFLFLTSSEGASALKITLTYADATTDVSNLSLPDYYADVSPTDLVLFNLAADLPKWTKTGTVAEMNHHNLTGVEIHPAAAKMLSSIKIEKSANGYLVFWGATGVATSAVETGDAGSVHNEAGSVVDAAGTGGGGGSAMIGVGGNATAGSGGSAMSGTGGVGSTGSPVEAGGAGGDGMSGGASSESGCSCRAARRSGSEWTVVGWLAVGGMLERRRKLRSGLPSRHGRSLAS